MKKPKAKEKSRPSSSIGDFGSRVRFGGSKTSANIKARPFASKFAHLPFFKRRNKPVVPVKEAAVLAKPLLYFIFILKRERTDRWAFVRLRQRPLHPCLLRPFRNCYSTLYPIHDIYITPLLSTFAGSFPQFQRLPPLPTPPLAVLPRRARHSPPCSVRFFFSTRNGLERDWPTSPHGW